MFFWLDVEDYQFRQYTAGRHNFMQNVFTVAKTFRVTRVTRERLYACWKMERKERLSLEEWMEAPESRNNQRGNRSAHRKAKTNRDPYYPIHNRLSGLTIHRHHDDPVYGRTHCRRSQVLLHITYRPIHPPALTKQEPSHS